MSDAANQPNAPLANEPAVPAQPTGGPAGQPTPPANEAPEASVTGFEKTGDIGLDMALEFIGNLGFGPEDELVKHAQSTGDFSLLEAKLASLGDKASGYDRFIALGKQAYQRFAEAEKTFQNAMQGTLDKVIPAEQQEEVLAYVKSQATEAELETFNELWNHSPLARRMVAEFAMNTYSKAHAPVEQEPATPLRENAAPAAVNTGALSPQEYAREVAKLAAKVGSHRLDRSPEYARLQQRRAAFRG